MKSWEMEVVHIDLHGRPTVTAGSDHYFRTCCLYVRPSVRPHFQNLAKQNEVQDSDRYWRDCGSGLMDH